MLATTLEHYAATCRLAAFLAARLSDFFACLFACLPTFFSTLAIDFALVDLGAASAVENELKTNAVRTVKISVFISESSGCFIPSDAAQTRWLQIYWCSAGWVQFVAGCEYPAFTRGQSRRSLELLRSRIPNTFTAIYSVWTNPSLKTARRGRVASSCKSPAR